MAFTAGFALFLVQIGCLRGMVDDARKGDIGGLLGINAKVGGNP
jgi:hypothetical protein